MADDEPVDRDGPDPDEAPDGAGVGRLPWYRRGTVWLGIVVVTAAGALVISDVAESSLAIDEVDASSAEAVAWCEAVLTSESPVVGRPAVGAEPADIGEQAAMLHALVDEAPVEIRGDVAELVAAWDVATQAPAEEVDDVLAEQLRRASTAERRVVDYTLEACGSS